MDYEYKTKPFKHQSDAIKESWFKEFYALFMEMGTGKSKVAIDNIGMLYEKELIKAALIIAPKGVYRNWERKELPTHMPDHITINIVSWSPEQTQKKKKELDTLKEVTEDLQIFLMNVEALSTKRGLEEADKFLSTHRTLLAVDESTTIKSRTAQRTKNLIKLGKTAP